MPFNHLILCHPFLLLSSIFSSITVFSNESVLHIRWPKYLSFSISPSNEYSGLISFRSLLCSRRPQVPSLGGEGTVRLHQRVWEARAGKWTQRASVLQRISLRGREREGKKERERERRHRDQSSGGAKVFHSTLCGYLYCLTRWLFSAVSKVN